MTVLLGQERKTEYPVTDEFATDTRCPLCGRRVEIDPQHGKEPDSAVCVGLGNLPVELDTCLQSRHADYDAMVAVALQLLSV